MCAVFGNDHGQVQTMGCDAGMTELMKYHSWEQPQTEFIRKVNDTVGGSNNIHSESLKIATGFQSVRIANRPAQSRRLAADM